jgi:lactoylglutathione lyase
LLRAVYHCHDSQHHGHFDQHTDDVDHLGFQTDDADELAELKARAQSAGMVLLDQGETSCCYARGDKYWLADPQGIAWEHSRTLDTIQVVGDGSVVPQAHLQAQGVCECRQVLNGGI